MTISRQLLAAASLLLPALSFSAFAQPTLSDFRGPSVPANLQVPDGNSLYLKAHATGSQNYVCTPGSSGPAWLFVGPQATLFVPLPFPFQQPVQIATHLLSTNPYETDIARPTWQSSFDTSLVWGKAAASSTDPEYVAPGAIPWLLVQATGVRNGPSGGTALSRTTYIQRVNTTGGSAPASGCDQGSYGRMILVTYTADYLFYQVSRK